jgi:MFS family permease
LKRYNGESLGSSYFQLSKRRGIKMSENQEMSQVVVNEKQSEEEQKFVREKNNIPYGGWFFSKKTGFTYFDKIIEDGYNYSYTDVKNMAKKGYGNMLFAYLGFLLVSVLIGVIAEFTDLFYTISELGSRYAGFEEYFIVAIFFIIILFLLSLFISFIPLKIMKINVRKPRIIQQILIFVIALILIGLSIAYIVAIIYQMTEYDEPIYALNIPLLILGLALYFYFVVGYSMANHLNIVFGLSITASLEVSRKLVSRNFSNLLFHYFIGFLLPQLLLASVALLFGIDEGFPVIFGVGSLFVYPYVISYMTSLFILVAKVNMDKLHNSRIV